MYLTAPQSRHFDPSRFAGSGPRENHFDWDLYYRFKDDRERFWRDRVDSDGPFRARIADHFTAFQRSIDDVLGLLKPVADPRVLDVGLSSEQLDRAILRRTGGHVVVLDVQQEAARSYHQAFGDRGSFVLGDVITYGREPANAAKFDLVYSVGLIEHFPDKSDIVGAHIRVTRPGGLVLLYVPIDTAENRATTALIPDWENFGHRELLTPDELGEICRDANLEILSVDAVGFFAAVCVRRNA